jgi:hypothetical protein
VDAAGREDDGADAGLALGLRVIALLAADVPALAVAGTGVIIIALSV